MLGTLNIEDDVDSKIRLKTKIMAIKNINGKNDSLLEDISHVTFVESMK